MSSPEPQIAIQGKTETRSWLILRNSTLLCKNIFQLCHLKRIKVCSPGFYLRKDFYCSDSDCSSKRCQFLMYKPVWHLDAMPCVFMTQVKDVYEQFAWVWMVLIMRAEVQDNSASIAHFDILVLELQENSKLSRNMISNWKKNCNI